MRSGVGSRPCGTDMDSSKLGSATKLRVAHRVFLPSAKRGVPHISLVFREMWDTTNLNLFFDLQKEARGALRHPTSREKRARYGAPHALWKGKDSCSSHVHFSDGKIA